MRMWRTRKSAGSDGSVRNFRRWAPCGLCLIGFWRPPGSVRRACTGCCGALNLARPTRLVQTNSDRPQPGYSADPCEDRPCDGASISARGSAALEGSGAVTSVAVDRVGGLAGSKRSRPQESLPLYRCWTHPFPSLGLPRSSLSSIQRCHCRVRQAEAAQPLPRPRPHSERRHRTRRRCKRALHQARRVPAPAW